MEHERDIAQHIGKLRTKTFEQRQRFGQIGAVRRTTHDLREGGFGRGVQLGRELWVAGEAIALEGRD